MQGSSLLPTGPGESLHSRRWPWMARGTGRVARKLTSTELVGSLWAGPPSKFSANRSSSRLCNKSVHRGHYSRHSAK